MPRKNWTKLGAMITFLALIIGMLLTIGFQISDKTDKYFALSMVFLFGFFVYFEFLKEYHTSRSKKRPDKLHRNLKSA